MAPALLSPQMLGTSEVALASINELLESRPTCEEEVGGAIVRFREMIR